MDDTKRRLAALETWKEYRHLEVASARMERGRDLWKHLVFWLCLVGLVMGPIAASRQATDPKWLAQAIGLVSGVAVALAAYLSESVLGSNPDVAWVRTRQAAEGLKSLAFAFLMRAPPFDAADTVEALEAERDRIESELASKTSEVALPIPDAEAEKGFPPFPLSARNYVTVRTQEQQRWFEQEALKNHNTANRLEFAKKLLGALAAVLAVFTSYYAGLPGWIAVITAAGGALGAQVTAGKYHLMEQGYHDTAARLARIVSRWELSQQGPEDDRRMVTDSESALRSENAAWVEGMLRKEAEKAATAPGRLNLTPSGQGA